MARKMSVSVPVRLSGFVAALGLVFAGTYAVGAVASPATTDAASGQTSGAAGHDGDGGHDAESGPGHVGLVVTVGQGYTVAVDGALVARRTSRLTLTVTRSGAQVTDLQPYLAAYGHLVVLRADDRGYLPVLAQDAPDDDGTAAGPSIVFDVEVPTAGEYRMFLDFRHGGVVRTAAFTATAA